MIIRCQHLREAGIMRECCTHCHVLAGCSFQVLPDGHNAIFCCGHMKLTSEEIATILARIPEWEARAPDTNVEPGISPSAIPEQFRPAYQAIQRLERDERYLAASISGSLARGEATRHSEFFVHVIVNEKKPGRHLCAPMLDGVVLNLWFLSLEQFEESVRKEIDQPERSFPLTIARSIIVFDKTRKLRRMQEGAQQLSPGALYTKRRCSIQSILLEDNDRIERCLEEQDPASALLLMHDRLMVLLSSHYRLRQRWRVNPLRLLADLDTWDQELAHLVRNFLVAGDVQAKFQCWSALHRYILQPLGEYQPVPFSGCQCRACRRDLAMLLEE